MSEFISSTPGSIPINDGYIPSIRTFESSLSQPQFVALLNDIVLSIKSGSPVDTVLGHKSLLRVESETASKIVTLLFSLYLDLTRCGVSKSSFQNTLEELGFSTANATSAADVYEVNSSSLAEIVSSAGFSLPQLVDINWKLTYLVSSQELGRIGKPAYVVEALFEEPSPTRMLTRRTVTFVCSPQEMELLLSRFQDALRAANSIQA